MCFTLTIFPSNILVNLGRPIGFASNHELVFFTVNCQIFTFNLFHKWDQLPSKLSNDFQEIVARFKSNWYPFILMFKERSLIY